MTDPTDGPTTATSPDAPPLPGVQGAVIPNGVATPPAGIFERLKHHKVLEWTLAYAAGAYTLLHGVEMVSEAMEWPHLAIRLLTIALFAGAPIVALLAWYHGHRARHRVSGAELVLLTLMLFIAGSLLWHFARNGERHATVAADTAPTAPPPVVARDPAPPPVTAGSVAVLPFDNETGDEKKGFLGEGLASDVINNLMRVSELKVKAKTSSFSFQGKHTDVKEIARLLGVARLIEGTVQSAGERIRINVQLIDGASGFQQWSKSFDRRGADLFTLQDEVVAEVVKAMKVDLHGRSVDSLAEAPPTQNLQAYTLYMQAEALARQTNVASAQLAAELYSKAIDLDPKFALAMVGEAQALGTIVAVRVTQNEAAPGSLEIQKLSERGKAALARARSIDPLLVAAKQYSVFGPILLQDDASYAKAYAEVRDTVNADQKNLPAMLAFGMDLVTTGRLRESLATLLAAYDQSPVESRTVATIAMVYSLEGDDARALSWANRAVELGYASGLHPIPAIRLRAELNARRPDGPNRTALAALDSQVVARSVAAHILTIAYAAAIDPTRARTALAKVRSLEGQLKPAEEPFLMCETSARMTAALSVDAAYELMEKCLGSQGTLFGPPLYDTWAPELRAFRRDARFDALVSRSPGMKDLWRQFGPPDGCELKNDKLLCH